MTAMTRLITCLETAAVYFVVAGALIGTVLSALDQFYPIYLAGRRFQSNGSRRRDFGAGLSPNSQLAKFSVDYGSAAGQDARRA